MAAGWGWLKGTGRGGAGAKGQEQGGVWAGFSSRIRLSGSWFLVLSAPNSVYPGFDRSCSAGGASPCGSVSPVALPGRRVSRLKKRMKERN